MTSHLMVRLPWHDRAWDGHICDEPVKNTYCTGNRSCSGDMIEKYKSQHLDLELKYRSASCSEVQDYIPPCSQFINTFSLNRIRHRHIPPDWLIPKTGPTYDNIERNTVGTWPYKEVANPGDRSEGNWLPFEEREINVNTFFDEFCRKHSEPSLLFFYLNFDNPLNSERRRFLLVGCTTLLNVGDPIRWEGMTRKDIEDPKIGNQVWTRWLQHAGKESAALFPLHELWKLREQGKITQSDLSTVLPEIPTQLREHFRYVCRNLNSGQALIFLEILSNALEHGKASRFLPSWNWDASLDWVNSQTIQLWKDRGQYPALGSVLTWLGHSQGMLCYRSFFKPLEDAGKDPIAKLKLLLKDYKKAAKDQQSKFKVASEKWKTLPASVRTFLLEKAVRVELSPEQLTVILDNDEKQRAPFGLVSSIDMIAENPYLLCEEIDEDRLAVSFESIDQAICPDSRSGHSRLVEPEDSSRLRAIAINFLTDIAKEGHTWVSEEDLKVALNRASKPCAPFAVDQYRLAACRDIWNPKIGYDPANARYYLKTIRQDEVTIEDGIERLLSGKPLTIGTKSIAWETKLKQKGTTLSADTEKVVLAAQAEACDRAYRMGISVINGSAGTGKTSTLKAVLQQIKREDKENILLLAFTGRAARVLEERTGFSASTIHHILKESKWLWQPTWRKKRVGGDPIVAPNIVIDEASMLDTALLSALFRALEWDHVRRVIFVGDTFQLPPIGPGKPFVDIIRRLTALDKGKDKSRYIASLNISIRHITSGSQALQVARAFRDGTVGELNDVLLDLYDPNRSEGDLSVRFFNKPEDLSHLLVKELIRVSGHDPSRQLYESFDNWLSIGNKNSLDQFQILAPFRKVDGAGVDDINTAIQTLLRSGIRDAIPRWGKPNKVGDFTFHDKIIITRNSEIYDGWDHTKKEKITLEVTNGQLGVVSQLLPKPRNGPNLPFWKKPEMSVRISFQEYPNCSVIVPKSQTIELLELGYATTVHKAQGSEFGTVFFVLPLGAPGKIYRELVYTALTRAKDRIVLFVQGDLEQLHEIANHENSAISSRRTNLLMPKPKDLDFPFELHHITSSGKRVASKSEALIHDALWRRRDRLRFEYNKKLDSHKGAPPRWPDFRIYVNGKEIFWEHAGRLTDPEYKTKFFKKQRWYQREELADRLIVSHELEGINMPLIESVIDDLVNADVASARKKFDPDLHQGLK